VTDLYRRGVETLVASWEAYARAAPGAAVHRRPGIAAAVFPDEPERGIYNNVLLERPGGLDDVESIYRAAGVTRFAVWVHDGDDATRNAVEARGYALDTSTRAMAMALEDLRAQPAAIEVALIDWPEQLTMFDLPPTLLAGGDLDDFHILAVRIDGANVASAIAFDHDGDCGIYNVGTLEPYRRRGLGAALTAVLLRDAAARGCTTASVQSTAMAEGVYANVGFRDLGRYLEFVPQ
jgi:GNAT superfamily N-acetyltransferase